MDDTDRLKQLKQAVSRAGAVKAAIEQAKEYREALEQKLKVLKESSFKEENEAAILEEDKVWAFFLSLRGNLSERIEKEKAEALAVKLKYQEAQKELAELDSAAIILTAEQAGLEGCDHEYEQYYDQKKQRLINEGTAASARILDLSEEAGRVRSRLAAIGGALEAGEQVIAALDNINGQLKQAEESDGDGMGGFLGLIVVSVDRRECLSEADGQAKNAQQLFEAFKTKAAKVTEMQGKTVLTGFLVADILFEGFTVKGGYQDRLDRLKSNAAVIRSEMLCNVIKLRQLSDEAQSALSGLVTKLDALVLGSAD